MKLTKKQKKYLLKTVNVTLLTGMLLSNTPCTAIYSVYAEEIQNTMEPSEQRETPEMISSTNNETEQTTVESTQEAVEVPTDNHQAKKTKLMNQTPKETSKYDAADPIVSQLVTKIKNLTFDELLSEFGGRKYISKTLKQPLHVAVSKEKEQVDQYQLDETFQALQAKSEEYVVAVLNQFEEYKSVSSDILLTKVFEELNSLLLVKTYLDRWYSITIGDEVLSEQLYFKQSSNQDILEMANKIKSNPAILQSNLTGKRYQEVFSKFFGYETVPELVEAFIKQETQSEDYDSWFHSYFKGSIYEKHSDFSQFNLSTWEKVKNNLNRTPSKKDSANGTDNLLLPLLTVKNSQDLILGNGPGILIYSTNKTYGNRSAQVMDTALENFTNHFNIFFNTQSEVKRNEMLSRVKTIPVYDSELYPTDVNGQTLSRANYLDKTNILSHEFYLAIGYLDGVTSTVNANAVPQGLTFKLANLETNSGGTLAHEYGHSISHILLESEIDPNRYGYRGDISIETIPSRINNNVTEWMGLPWVTYESTKYSNHSASPLSNHADRFQKPKDLQEYFGGYVGMVYALNKVVADVVLEMPLEDQVGYIRQWDDAKRGVRSLTKQEIEALHLKTVDDLVDNQIAILDKAVKDGKIGSVDFGENYYTRYSLYYADKAGEGSDKFEQGFQTFDSLMSLPQYEGWNAVQLFFSKMSGVTTNLEALRLVLNDPEMDFIKFRKQQLNENGNAIKTKGFRYHTYAQVKQLFKDKPDNFEKVKTDLYKEYMEKTSEFRNSIYLEDNEIMAPEVEGILQEETVLKGNGIPQATIIAKTGEKEIGKGTVKEDGTFEVTIEPQKTGTTITVIQTIADRESKNVEVVVEAGIKLDSELIASKISTQLGIETTHIFKNSQIKTIYSLEIKNNKNFVDKDLEDIGKLFNLTTLRLDGNQIQNVSPLKTLTKLKTLYLPSNKIQDISALAGMKELSKLMLWTNEIKDITPLKDLDKLKQINLASNQIKEVSALADKSSKITQLELQGNQIADITPVKKAVTNAKNQTITAKKQQVKNGKLSMENTIQLTGLANFGKFIVTASDQGSYDETLNQLSWENLPEENLPENINYQFSFNQKATYSGTVIIPVEGVKELDPPIVNPVFSKDQTISGKGLGHSKIKAKVNGQEIGQGTVKSDGTFEFSIDPQKIGTKITVTQVIDGQESPAVEVVVEAAKITTYNTYKLGYWRSYGFILEGQSGVEDQRFTQKDDVIKMIELINTKTQAIEASTKATNTNWYDSGNYDGYQAILTNETIEKLSEGNYRLRVTMTLKDGETVTENLTSAKSFVYDFIGDYQEQIAKLGIHSVNDKVISFSEGFNQVTLNITKGIDQVNVLNSRVNTKGDNVADLWIASNDYDFRNEHTKHLVIKDSSGKEVYNKKAPTWNIKKTFNKQVKSEWEKAGTQAIIPKGYRGTSFSKEIQVKDQEENVQITTIIPQEFLQ